MWLAWKRQQTAKHLQNVATTLNCSHTSTSSICFPKSLNSIVDCNRVVKAWSHESPRWRIRFYSSVVHAHFLTCCIFMFGTGWIRSISLTFWFLRGRIWGRGRLFAAIETQRPSATTASMHRHTPAILEWWQVTLGVLLSCGTFQLLYLDFSVLLIYSTFDTKTVKKCTNRWSKGGKQCETGDGQSS